MEHDLYVAIFTFLSGKISH